MSDLALGPGRPVRHDLVTVARACLANGGHLDQAAHVVLARTTSPIDAIKALRTAQLGLSLADAKPLVHRTLPAHLQGTAGQLWDDLELAVREIIDQQ